VGRAQVTFVTYDSGERQRYESGMQRDISEGKIRFDLIAPLDLPYEEQMITRWAGLMTRGAVKYDARNWEQADGPEEYHRFRESAIRHFLQWFLEADDREDHAAAVLFNIQGAEYVRYQMEKNDL
jgi:dATP/dGTP diphosphohydrolase